MAKNTKLENTTVAEQEVVEIATPAVVEEAAPLAPEVAQIATEELTIDKDLKKTHEGNEALQRAIARMRNA